MNRALPEELFQFFAGCFHEDWSVDAQSANDVISQYMVEQRDISTRHRVAGLIEVFVEDRHHEPKLLATALVDDLGCYYDPSVDGRTAEQWLLHVAARLRGGGG
jgi:hypothetical protein